MSGLLSNVMTDMKGAGSGLLSNVMADVEGTGTGTGSNFFSDIMTDMKGMEQNLLGPDYLYWKRILKPSDMGMSADGNLETLASDVGGLINYVEVLVTGNAGSTTGGPLGDKFFLKTGGQCTDVASGKKVDRYIYIDNVPNGNIPFISSGLGGTDFTEFEGLIPGLLGDLGKLNPLNLFKSFMTGDNPDCMSVTLQTIIPVEDADLNDTGQDNVGSQTQYLAVADVKNMDPCIFPGKTNPADPSLTCKEAFMSRRIDDSSSSDDEGGAAFGNIFSTHSTHNKKKSGCNALSNYKRIDCINGNGGNGGNGKRRIKSKASPKALNAMDDLSKLPDDMYVRAFYILMTAFSLYVFYRLTKRISNARS